MAKATFTKSQLESIFNIEIDTNFLFKLTGIIIDKLNDATGNNFGNNDVTVDYASKLFQVSAPGLTSEQILDALNQ
jgi:hypothetical protein